MENLKQNADISEIEEHDYMEDTLTDLSTDYDTHEKI